MRVAFDHNLRAMFWALVGVSAFWVTSNVPVVAASAIAFLVFLVCLWRSYRTHGFFDGVTTLLLFMGLFHLGMIVPINLFGTAPPLVVMPWLNGEGLSFSIALVTLGMAMTCAGAEFANDRKRHDVRLRGEARGVATLWTTITFVFALLYLFLGIQSDILFSPRSVYLALDQTGESAPFGIAKSFMILSGFIAASFAPKRLGVPIAIFVLTMLLPMFAFGQRGEFLVTAAAFAVVLVKKGVRFNPLIALPLGASILFLIPLLRNVRGGVESFSRTALLDPIYEMGMQLRTVHYTVVAVRSEITDYWYGASYIQALMRSVPNVAGLREVLGGARSDSPNTWLTDVFRPGGAGLGYSIFAEPFLNFGVVGVVVVLFLVGLGVRKLERSSTRSLGSLAVYGVFVQSILWAVRNDFYGVFRPLIWVSLLLFLSGIVVAAVGKPSAAQTLPSRESTGD